MSSESIKKRIEQLEKQIANASISSGASAKTASGRSRIKAYEMLIRGCEEEIRQLKEHLSNS